jgi:thiosulfate dehydrogenase
LLAKFACESTPDAEVTMEVAMMTRSIPLVLLIGLIASGVLAAEGSTPNGSEIAHFGNGNGAPACTGCHGKQFEGDAAYKAPALAGLSAAFIMSRLAHYAGPDGHNAYMRQVATALSLEQREAVADYLSHLPRKKQVN